MDNENKIVRIDEREQLIGALLEALDLASSTPNYELKWHIKQAIKELLKGE